MCTYIKSAGLLEKIGNVGNWVLPEKLPNPIGATPGKAQSSGPINPLERL